MPPDVRQCILGDLKPLAAIGLVTGSDPKKISQQAGTDWIVTLVLKEKRNFFRRK
jgi:hypothetical protein